MMSGSDRLSGNEPEAQRIAANFYLRVRDAGLDGTGGAFILAGLRNSQARPISLLPPTGLA